MLRLMAKDYLPPMGLLPPTPIVLLTLFLRLCLDKAQWKRISDGAGTKSQTPALCLSHFALQIKVTSTTAHLFCTRDGMGRIRKRKQKKKKNDPPPWKHNEYICLPLCPCQIKCARHIWP